MRTFTLATALVLAVGSGCLVAPSEACENDSDCDGDDDGDGDGECTRLGECVEAGTSIRVVLEWTVAGRPPTEAACAPFDELGVYFYDGEREAKSYLPVPCPIGRSTYDKMPPRLDRVALVAYDDEGDVIDRAERNLTPAGETLVQIDLEP